MASAALLYFMPHVPPRWPAPSTGLVGVEARTRLASRARSAPRPSLRSRTREGRAARRVRWYVFVEGAEVDLHNAHWHGNVLLRDGHRVDQCVPAHSPTQTLCMRAYKR